MEISFFNRMMMTIITIVIIAEVVEYWAILAHPQNQVLVVLWMIFVTILAIGLQLWYWLPRYGIKR